MNGALTGNELVTLACMLVVAVYAANRYDTPETNRFSTTRSLFLVTGAGYVAASLVLFFLLSEIILKPGVLPFLGVENATELSAKFSAPPILAAFLFTTLLPNTPVIKTVDDWILKRFQNWGRIPGGVRQLAGKLTPDALPVGDADVAKLQAWIFRTPETPNGLSVRVGVAASDTPAGGLTHILMLYKRIGCLRGLPRYANALTPRQDGWPAIAAEMPVFAAQSQAFFVLFDQLAPLPGAMASDALKQAEGHYSDICDKLRIRLAEHLAQLLTVVEATEQRVKDRLAGMGFCIEGELDQPLPVGPLVFMGVMMILTMFGIVAIFHRTQSGPLPPAIGIVLIGMTKTMGVLAAILPKVRWKMFRADDRGRLPYLGWLLWAALAAVAAFAFAFERTAIALVTHVPAAALDFQHYPMSPIAPTTFVISLCVAILCDVDLRLGDGWLRRVTEGLLCAAAMTACVFVCTRLFNLQSATESQTSAWFPFAFSFSLGLIGGLFGPHLYRLHLGVGAAPAGVVGNAPPPGGVPAGGAAV